MTTVKVKKCVERGAELLDDRVPGWEGRVNLDKLHMDYGAKEDSELGYCLLTHIFGSWKGGMKELFGEQTIMDAHETSDRYGFGQEQDFPGLTNAWDKLIESRRVPPTLDDAPEPPASIDIDEFIRKHAKELERIYEDRTAGDFTFHGFMYAMLKDLESKGVIDFN